MGMDLSGIGFAPNPHPLKNQIRRHCWVHVKACHHSRNSLKNKIAERTGLYLPPLRGTTQHPARTPDGCPLPASAHSFFHLTHVHEYEQTGKTEHFTL